MIKVGFYSGTFDPVHVGHIEFALAAAKQAGLEKVIFLPENTPREKDDVTHLKHRINMLKLAIKPYSNLELVTLVQDRFTVDTTLPILQSMFTGKQLVFLCGSDVVKTFLYRWEGLERLLKATEVIVGVRKNDSSDSIKDIFNELNIYTKYTLVNAPQRHLASTDIRSGSSKIKDIDPLVAEYIVKSRLYGSF